MNLLEGVRVLDVTEALAGPYCTAILSDLGAEVVKVERVDGDPMRRRRATGDGVSVPFEMIQRGKHSIALDFRQPEGAEALLRLAGSFDVMIENFRPGVLRKYGLDAPRVLERHPSLVYCSISGFGQTGPLRDEKGVDLVAQGFAGLMSVTGFAEKGPAKAGYPIGDLGSAMWAAIGITAALHRRTASGEGCAIDVSLSDAIAAWSLWEVADYQMSGRVPEALGTAHRLTAPYQAFPCRDGRWITMAGLDRQWPDLCRLLEVEHLLEEPRFTTEYSRFEHRDDLAAALESRFLTRDRDDWIEALRAIGIPCGPVHDMATMLEEPQFEERGMFVDMKVGDASLRLVNTPIVADGVPRVRTSAPSIGADTISYLTEVGYSKEEIEALATARVVGIGEGK
jgi:crotonobetainyl-CoA:carnitine CoA-transferase CaiB-like acyl-CoA transferase